MALKPIQGQTLGYDTETALGTSAGSVAEFRFNENVEAPTPTRTLIANPNVGHAHPGDKGDKPIAIENGREDALKFQTRVRMHGTVETDPLIATFLQSGGANVDRCDDTTIAVYTDASNFTLTDASNVIGGEGCLVELDSGLYYPALVTDNSAGAVDLAMELPSAASNGNAIEIMSTITPRSEVVGATETLSFEHLMRAVYNDTEDLAMKYKGCAFSSMGDITITPNEPINLDWSFHVADVADAEVDFNAESFADNEKFIVADNNFRIEYGTYASGGGIARNDIILQEAVITLGFKCVPVKGFGSGTLNGWQGYMAVMEEPKIKITGEYLVGYWTELEGSNTSKYIGLVQPTSSLASPAMGFWLPNSYLDPANPPVIDYTGNSYVAATVTFLGSAAKYDSKTLPGESAAAPWFWSISAHSTFS